MGFTQDFLTSRRNIDDGSIRVGELERLWYSSSDNTIRIGDGTTPGGIIVSGGGGGGSYVLPTASTTVKGGVKIDGTTIKITNEVISGFDGNYNSLTNKPTIFSGSYNDLSDKPVLFSGNYNDLTDKPVLFSGNYNDLTNKPTIPAAQVQVDWNSSSGITAILNKPILFSGSYTDLTNKPVIPAAQVQVDWNAIAGITAILNKPVLFSGSYTDLTNKPTLFSGSYNDLTDKPVLFSGNYNDLTNKPVLFSGNYNDLTNKPTIPAAQINSDWLATSGVAEILNKPTIPDITGITEVFAATSEPMGHADITHSLISFDNSSRTFTISPVNSSYDIWVKGTKWVITNSRSVTIPDITGIYYIYFDSTGTLHYKTTFFDWPNDCMTAYVYWNKLTGKAPYVADERHGITLDWQTHEYLHRTRGAAIASGFSATNYILNGDGSLDSHLHLDISSGTFFDEDLQVDIINTNTPVANTWQQDLAGPARIPMFYINSGGGWVMDNPTDFPVKQGSALPVYNLLTNGVGSNPDIDNNKFGVSFILATNNINYPVIGIIGQSQHANQGDAEAVNFTDLSLPGFPVVELRQLYKLVYQCKTSYTNTVHARLASIFDLRSFSSTTSAMATYTDHGSLSGLLDDDHPQYLLRTDTNALNVLSNTSSSMSWINTVFAPSSDAKTTITASQGAASIQLIKGFPAGVSTSVSFTFNSNGTLTFPDNTTQSTAFTGIQTSVSGNAGTATTLQTARNINGVSFNGSADITVTAAAGTLSGSTLASGVTSSSLTSVGTLSGLTTSNNIDITYSPATAVGAAIQVTAKNTQGGIGWADFLKVTNNSSGATNPTRWFRLNNTGTFEIINSAYTSSLLGLTNSGDLSVLGKIQVAGKQAVNGPAFSVYRDSVQTIPTDVLTLMTWTAEEYDTDNCVTSTRFTPTVAGYYALVATVRIDGGIGTGERMISIKKNGNEYRRGMNAKGSANVGDSWFQLDVSCQVYANGTGDYFEVFVQHGAGADRNTTSGQPFTAFQGCMLRGA